MVAAALAMGGLLWLALRWLPAQAAETHGLAQAAVLIMLISGAIAIYGLLLALFGVTDWRQTVNALRQTRTGDLRD